MYESEARGPYELLLPLLSPSMQVSAFTKQSVLVTPCFVKGKAVPQHTYGGAGGRGCIAPTHSRPWH
jgi:hypothetical protein